jgi:hypothetical protein
MTNTTTSTRKPTKRMNFEALLAIPEVAENSVLVSFIEHEIELLDKKNSADKKPTAKQTANAGIKGKIVELMQAEPNRLFTVTEIMKMLDDPTFTNQKVSALMRQLYDITGTDPMNESFALLRVEEKRKAYFKINPNFEG